MTTKCQKYAIYTPFAGTYYYDSCTKVSYTFGMMDLIPSGMRCEKWLI